ncbi:MAG: nucleoside-diphosphate kinase [Candidatus Syntrophosphaera sp.]|nr:nucleoside-diphosphate kinase [Candidatus Syntrophosphaera sp.]
MSQRSLLLIKPNAVLHHHVGHVISILEEAGFELDQIKEFQFTPEAAAVFYEAHKGKGFYERLIAFMCSGPTIALIVEKDNAVEDLRELIGEVDPARRKPGTIRDLYAEGVTENAVHASDSLDNAEREIALLFAE